MGGRADGRAGERAGERAGRRERSRLPEPGQLRRAAAELPGPWPVAQGRGRAAWAFFARPSRGWSRAEARTRRAQAADVYTCNLHACESICVHKTMQNEVHHNCLDHSSPRVCVPSTTWSCVITAAAGKQVHECLAETADCISHCFWVEKPGAEHGHRIYFRRGRWLLVQNSCEACIAQARDELQTYTKSGPETRVAGRALFSNGAPAPQGCD